MHAFYYRECDVIGVVSPHVGVRGDDDLAFGEGRKLSGRRLDQDDGTVTGRQILTRNILKIMNLRARSVHFGEYWVPS